MQRSALETVNEFYEAFAVGDIDRVLATLSDNLHWSEAEDYLYADKNPYIGKMEFLEGIVTRAGEDWDGLAVKVDSISVAGETQVIAQGRYFGTHRRTGKSLDCQTAHFWTVSDGKIVKFQQYANTAHAQRVAML